MRTWQVERRKRTRHLIELGGLVIKAGIVDLTGDDRATIYGALSGWPISSRTRTANMHERCGPQRGSRRSRMNGKIGRKTPVPPQRRRRMMRCDRWRAARRHQRRSAARHRFTYPELPVVQHPRSRARFTPPRLHVAPWGHDRGCLPLALPSFQWPLRAQYCRSADGRGISEAVIRAARRIDCCGGVPSVPYAAAHVGNAQTPVVRQRLGERFKSGPLLPFVAGPVRRGCAQDPSLPKRWWVLRICPTPRL